MIAFSKKLEQEGCQLNRHAIHTLQINIGKKCNQACHHCHVEAGPKRTEQMNLDTINRLQELMDSSKDLQTLDITGGAPELNQYFRGLVIFARKRNLDVIDRCNLTVLFEKGQEDTAAFLANHQVHVVASLPCYSSQNVDAQRGNGVFNKSIKALQLLNNLGYGKEGSGLVLDLVYNPLGDFLPPSQDKLEQDYKKRLQDDFGICFNHLFTITNMPIKRYKHYLIREGKMQDYMQLLLDNFNPHSVNNVMCTAMVSVGYDGVLYDCDFNQMLELPLKGNAKTIWDIESLDAVTSQIVKANHCYGCTAGAGSSCGGALV
tara:strand:+ start:375 stop:1328 length:954 start_codon:yes stop_codon:yes gene_type:complete